MQEWTFHLLPSINHNARITVFSFVFIISNDAVQQFAFVFSGFECKISPEYCSSVSSCLPTSVRLLRCCPVVRVISLVMLPPTFCLTSPDFYCARIPCRFVSCFFFVEKPDA